MNYHILYNPLAGNGKHDERIQALSSQYENQCSCRDITKINDYADFFASIEQTDVIILCGGDGTLNRFINDTDGMEIPNDILYYAMGTGNDFLKDLKKEPNVAPFSVKSLIRNLPIVEVNGKRYRFLNNVGFGIDGYCCEVGDEQKKTSDKPVNYTMIAIKGLLFHYKPTGATVRVDGETYRYEKVWLAPTMKGRFYGGGMIPNPSQNRNDTNGTLSLMLFYGKGKLKTLSVFPSIFKGEHIKHTEMVAIHQGTDICVTFDSPAAVQIDGETICGVTSYRAMAKAPVETFMK